MEGPWTGLRNSLRMFRGVNKKYLYQYVAIFAWGYNIKRVTPEFIRAMLGVPITTFSPHEPRLFSGPDVLVGPTGYNPTWQGAGSAFGNRCSRDKGDQNQDRLYRMSIVFHVVGHTTSSTATEVAWHPSRSFGAIEWLGFEATATQDRKIFV